MRTLCTTLLLIASALMLASCDKLLNPLNDGTQVPARHLFFKYTEIPASMTDAAAVAQILDTRDNYIRRNFTQKIFPVTDSADQGVIREALNRIRITTSGSGGNAELHGGEDPSLHPPQTGVPTSLTLNVDDGHEVGVTHYVGSWELQFGGGIIARNTQTGNHIDTLFYTLQSYDATTSYATGTFAFIARTEDDPPRRWIIFDGEFALTRGRN